jgi:predicted O-methyltransferase YrrM
MSNNPIDKAYLEKYPAPLLGMIMEKNPFPMNSTTPFYGMLLYSMCRVISAHRVLEIGVDAGWSSWFMAMAVLENSNRHKEGKGSFKYIGVDIGNKKDIFDKMKEQGLPVEFLHMDSLDLTVDMVAPLDLVFQDGWHNTKHCLKELEVIYPALKNNGQGYLIMHDVYSTCEEYFKVVSENKEKWNFEITRFQPNYGVAICRKMEGVDPNKIYWPEGPEPDMPRREPNYAR